MNVDIIERFVKTMKRLPGYIILIALAIALGCKKDKQIIKNNGKDLPLLGYNKVIGMIEGFNGETPLSTKDSIKTCWDESIANGMKIARLQVDWPDLEPTQGYYNKSLLENQLQDLSEKGVKTFLLISAYDSEGPDVPDYLEGVKFNNQKMTERYNRLMDWVIPLLVEYDGYAISVSNEPDNSFEDDSELAKQITFFFKGVRDHIHTLNENMAVSITMNIGNFEKSKEAMKPLMDEVDYGCFNVYGSGLFPMDEPFTAMEIEEDIDEMLAFSGSKNIIIQELGMHSDSALLNSSEEIQKNFFKTFFSRMENEDRIKAAYVFQLVDWSSETVEVLNSTYEDGTPEWFIEQYGKVLKTIGLISYEDGSRKMAWKEVQYWIKKFD